MMENFTYSLPIQARWNDLDPLGHVNNGIYISYFELGRGRFMLEASKTWRWDKHMFLIGNVTANFHKELKLQDINPTVWCRTKTIGNKSFVVEYLVTSDAKDGSKVIHASGETTQILFDMFAKKTIAIEPWLRDELTAYEKAGTIK
ncbi:MAG: acyl-CoA thioesterase [Chitinophagales bacterium]